MSDEERPGATDRPRARASEPEDLRERIGKLRKEQTASSVERGLANAMALFLSMGISMVGAIYGGFLLGRYLDHRAGTGFYLPLMLLLGVAAGASIVYQMLKPFLK